MRSNLIHLLFLLVLFLVGTYLCSLSYILLWFLISSIYAFLIYGWDKALAKSHWMRVSEMNLYFLAALGGFVGAFLGMKVFKHKTNKSEFRYRFMLSCLIGFSVYTVWVLKA
jgi:uncharacterized membrane protein YsdA (DUF1294 family)